MTNANINHNDIVKEKTVLYHYFPIEVLDKILAVKKLSAPERHKRIFGFKHPAVWFTTNSRTSPLSEQMFHYDGVRFSNIRNEKWDKMDIGRVSIYHDTFLLSWDDYLNVCGMKREINRRKPRFSSNWGYIYWFASIHEVDSRFWLKVESFDGKMWKKVNHN